MTFEFEMLVGQMTFILQDVEQMIRYCERIVFNPKQALKLRLTFSAATSAPSETRRKAQTDDFSR